MRRVKKIYGYSIEKLKGCFYKMTFFDARGKKVTEIIETPRFWLLLSNNVRKAIRATHLLPVGKKNKR